jgi:GNAT superfamily N-acetyltransferase
MEKTAQEPSTAECIRAIENNLFASMLSFRHWPRIETHDDPEVLWVTSDIPSLLFNSILRARLLPDRIDAIIQERIAQGKARHVPLLWWTGPATQPADLGDHLQRHGFIHDEDMPGMAVGLARLPHDLPISEGLEVRRVKDPALLKQWSQVCAAGFGMPEFMAEAFYSIATCCDPATFRAYLGWLDGKPVATSLVLIEAGVAGLYNVATLPEARRKGIGAALTVLPLLDAETEGYRLGILQASEMGASVYRALGFQEYCKIGQYIWRPEG